MFSLFSSVPLIACMKDASPANGKALSSEKSLGAQVRIVCNLGYGLKDQRTDTRICQQSSGEWSGSDEDFCQRVQCLEQLVLPPHTQTEGPLNLNPVYETVVNTTCAFGYRKVDGGTEVECSANGTWVWTLGILSCERILCSKPGVPANGAVLHKPDNYFYQSVVVFSCNSGFNLIGEIATSCGADGNWSDSLPTCKFSFAENFFFEVRATIKLQYFRRTRL